MTTLKPAAQEPQASPTRIYEFQRKNGPRENDLETVQIAEGDLTQEHMHLLALNLEDMYNHMPEHAQELFVHRITRNFMRSQRERFEAEKTRDFDDNAPLIVSPEEAVRDGSSLPFLRRD